MKIYAEFDEAVREIEVGISAMLGRSFRLRHFLPQRVRCPLNEGGTSEDCNVLSEFWVSENFWSLADARRIIRLNDRDDESGLTWHECWSVCETLNDRFRELFSGTTFRFALPTQPHCYVAWMTRNDPDCNFERGPTKHVEYCFDSEGRADESAGMQCGPLRPDLRVGSLICNEVALPGGYTGLDVQCFHAGFRPTIHSVGNGVAAGVPLKIQSVEWGKIIASDGAAFRDAKFFPGGKRNWDWLETRMHHVPGVGVLEVEELLNWGVKTLVIGIGFEEKLQVRDDLKKALNERGVTMHVLNTKLAVVLYNHLVEENSLVGGVFHTTC